MGGCACKEEERSRRARQRRQGAGWYSARSASGNNRQGGAAAHPILGAWHDAVDVGHHAGGGKGASGQQAPDAAAGVHRNGVQRVVNLQEGRQAGGELRQVRKGRLSGAAHTGGCAVHRPPGWRAVATLSKRCAGTGRWEHTLRTLRLTLEATK